ncbi:MAG: hypothetical protein ACFN04_07540 [Propionibacterium acidifaciens]
MTSAVILGFSPHTGQAGFFATGISRRCAPQASSNANLPSSGCPAAVLTMRQRLETQLRRRVPGMRAVEEA